MVEHQLNLIAIASCLSRAPPRKSKCAHPEKMHSGECSKKSCRAGIVTKRFAGVRKNVDVAGAKNKTSAELKRIFPEFVLMMAGFMRSLTCFRIVAAQEMKKIGGLQLRCAIGLTLFVN